MFRKEIYIERREKLSEKMGKGIGIFLGNVDSPRDYADNCYNFAQDSTFRYFFGMDRVNLVGIIDFEKNLTYVSGTDYTLGDMIWMGEQPTIKEEAERFGILNFIPMADFNIWFDNFSKEREIVFIKPHRAENLLMLTEILAWPLNDVKKHESQNLLEAIIEMRNCKNSYEIEEIEKAVNVTRLMHLKAMELAESGVYEYEIAAAVEAVAASHNCTPAFHTICSVHGEVLHNHNHGGLLKEGEILLLDCGAKTASGYCGDMTTSIPVSGKYSPRQKEIYNILIEMFDAAVSKLAREISFKEAHNAACRVLIERFSELGLLKGDREAIFENSAHALFFPHGLGHMLGMDVHDMENYGENLVGYGNEERDTRFGFRSLRLGRKLKPGYVFTVEPGIYFIPRLIADWKERGICHEFLNFEKIEEYVGFGGMRYEGDFLVTENGVRRLGEKMPKTAHEIESLMHELKAPIIF